jgi:hypothetical protein
MMDLTFYTGDSRNLLITVVDQNDGVITITDAAIEWILISQGKTVLSKEVGAGITISNPTAGQFTISLTANDTRSLSGTYQHMTRVTTSDGNSSIVLTGTITVQESLI